MSTALAGAVELLDRSLAYTRGALAGVRPEHLELPTPCLAWPLGRLLSHMDDALDAYGEAVTGRVSLTPSRGPVRVESIQAKACALLGWWLEHSPHEVALGDQRIPSRTLVSAAAVEITVHGWDVHTALGRTVPVPDDLAGPLLSIAEAVVGTEERVACFAPPVMTGPGATDSERLLAFVGRG